MCQRKTMPPTNVATIPGLSAAVGAGGVGRSSDGLTSICGGMRMAHNEKRPINSHDPIKNNAALTPMTNMRNPAIDGAMSLDVFMDKEPSTMALRSWRRGTNIGMSDCRAGLVNATVEPNTKAKPRPIPKVASSKVIITASPRAATTATAWARISCFFRSHLSAMRPAGNRKRAAGIPNAKIMVPTSIGESSSTFTHQAKTI